MNKAVTKEKSDDPETMTFKGESNLEVSKELPFKVKDLDNFSIPCMVGNVNIARALFVPGSGVHLTPYFIFKKLDLGQLQPIPISL